MVCIVEEADATLSDVSYLESDVNRFYFHSGVDSTALISFSPAVGVESRLFCRITDLGIPGNPVYEYVGDSFVVRYTSISLEYLARQNATVTFTLLPKGLYPVFKTSNGSNGSNEPNEPNELNELNEPNELNELKSPTVNSLFEGIQEALVEIDFKHVAHPRLLDGVDKAILDSFEYIRPC